MIPGYAKLRITFFAVYNNRFLNLSKRSLSVFFAAASVSATELCRSKLIAVIFC